MVHFDNDTLIMAVEGVRQSEIAFDFCENTTVGKNRKLRTRKISREGGTNIGGLCESTLHLALKYCIEPDNSYHEVASFGCELDVFKNNKVYEIQTKNFGAIKKKLAKVPDNVDLTVVFPVIVKKRIMWFDAKSGEISGGRVSPQKETSLMMFRELIYINELLKRPNLHFCIVKLECDDYKLLCGKDKSGKKGAVRYNRVPVKLVEIENFESYEDYFLKYIPNLDELGQSFTTEDFSKKFSYDINVTRIIFKLISLMGYIERIGSKNRYYLYKKIKDF